MTDLAQEFLEKYAKNTDVDPDDLITGGPALHALLSHIDPDQQLTALKSEFKTTRSVSKRNEIVKKMKYLAGLQKNEMRPDEAFIIHHMPVAPPEIRPVIPQGNNRIEYADVNNLYKDHMLINKSFGDVKDFLTHDNLIEQRKALYDGAKAIFGLGDAVAGDSRGKNRKGFIKQITGDSGPKQGLFHSKLLSKKQDFSGRATIYAEPNLGFNEIAVPSDMIWQMYEFLIIRDLVQNGYDYISAKNAVKDRNTAATNSFNKVIKQVPLIANRAPTLMRTNITAHFPVPTKGKTIGVNPLHLPMYAGDFDGDAFSTFVPMTPEAIQESKTKLLPENHLFDYRKGLGNSMVAPGHEAVLGAVYMTEPDMKQKPVHFATEQDALKALKEGHIKENTPITIGTSKR